MSRDGEEIRTQKFCAMMVIGWQRGPECRKMGLDARFRNTHHNRDSARPAGSGRELLSPPAAKEVVPRLRMPRLPIGSVDPDLRAYPATVRMFSCCRLDP